MRGITNILTAAVLLISMSAEAYACCGCPDGWRGQRWTAYHVDRTIITQHPCGNYPASAARAGATGMTLVRVRVSAGGWVQSARLYQSSGRADLDRAAVACAAGWHINQSGWQVVRVVWHWHSYRSWRAWG